MLRSTMPRPSEEHLPTIAARFGRAVRENPRAAFVHDGTTVLTRQDVAHRSEIERRRLIDAGVRRGDVVAVQLPNRAATVAVLHAVWAIGAVPCAITPIYRGAELGAIMAAAHPRAVVVPTLHSSVDYLAMAREAASRLDDPPRVLGVDLDKRIDDERARVELAAPPIASADDVALLMFTSGTTGRPKGVLHTHRTLTVEAQSIAEVFALGADAVFMPSPLGHVTGLLYGVVMPLLTGSSVVLMDRWDADEAAERIEQSACRFTVAATPFLRGLADAYRRRGTPSSLDVFVCGGADIPAALVEEARTSMGTRVCRTYGSTEMPTLCIVRPDDPPAVAFATEGGPLGGVGRLVDADGDLGDLEVRGPELFVGYLDPADNEAAFTADGWFRTGDLARILPGGQIAIAGRRKDLIVRGGENISAKEVEDLLLRHPSVTDVAVVGIPDELMGERACAVVIPTGERPALAELTAHLSRSSIARQKFPEALWIVETFPRTASGKVQKFQLRAQLLEALGRGEVELRRR